MNSVAKDIERRMAGLYETIRSAESSLSIASWIADHRDEVCFLGSGPLFQHLQYMAYVDYVVTTVALFDRNPDSNSVRNLWELIKKVETDPVEHLDVFNYVKLIEKQFPGWSNNDEDVDTNTLTGILKRFRYKRDKVIAHRELLKDYSSPKASIEIIAGGCDLLSFATEIYDFTATLISYPHRFRTTHNGPDGLLPHVRHISQQFENVVNGVFAQKKKERGLI
jgi:hypothetical protein